MVVWVSLTEGTIQVVFPVEEDEESTSNRMKERKGSQTVSLSFEFHQLCYELSQPDSPHLPTFCGGGGGGGQRRQGMSEVKRLNLWSS
jgi:hypothetical protein